MSRPRRRVDMVAADERADDSSGGFEATNSAISSQLKLIKSTKATERARGVRELADMLRDDQRGRRTLAASIPEAAWEEVVSWTAGIITKESQVFVNKAGPEWPQVSPQSERVGARIQTHYATPVRHIWVAAMPHVSVKLARFLIKHITDTLAAEPCLAHVFALDYAKVLRAWSAHAPHVYHCKDSRAKAIVDWCVGSLARSSVGSQASGVSEPSIMPGDAELAATLLAVVSAATPARLASLSDTVLDFCLDYCSQHARETACTAMVLDVATTVLLATADTQLTKRPDRIQALLETVQPLWKTRTPHVQLAALHAMRVLTRLVAHIVGERADPDARRLLELVLGTMTDGRWDRFRFMQLPRELLSLWPMVHASMRAAATPAELFAPLHTIVEAAQVEFFDTVAYLAAVLTKFQSRETEEVHRRKRARRAPTSLARLVTTMASDDSTSNARGAAQVIWYMTAVYPQVLGQRQCVELLEEVCALVHNSDMSQHGNLAEWALGILRMLAPLSRARRSFGDDVWQHAVAGAEAGLAGAAGLTLYMLRESDTNVIHKMCQKAAAALGARTAPHDADSTQLLLFLAQYIDPPSKSAAQAILQLCDNAVKGGWPVGLFTAVLSSALELPPLEASDPTGSVFGPEWSVELRFAHTLHTLALLSDSREACTRLLEHHMQPRVRQGARAPPISSLSPTQWLAVCMQLLMFIEQCTAYEVGQVLATAVLYVAHALWRISGQLPSSEAAQVAQQFGERLVSFVAEFKDGLELVWRTLLFVAPWSAGYARVAALPELTDCLLNTLLSSSDAPLLCALADGDSAARSVAVMYGSKSSADEPQTSERAAVSRSVEAADADGQPSQRQRGLLEVRMLSMASQLAPSPGVELVRVLTAFIEQRDSLKSVISTRLATAVARLDDAQFLLASEVLARCCILDGSMDLLVKLKERTLAFLENYCYTRHMPTLFCVLRVVCTLVNASAENTELESYEDLPRFVAWLDSEACHGRVDPFIEIEFLRALAGPWSRNNRLTILSVLEVSAVNMLVRRAQTAASFVLRMVAEEQLAWLGLALPFVYPDGQVAYPDAAKNDVDEVLMMMTRNFGLALLVCDSGSVPPGVLTIILRQLREGNDLSPSLAALCRRLLACMAAATGYSSTSQLLAESAPDICSADLELHSTLVELLDDKDAECQAKVSAALELMLRAEFAQAREVLASVEVGDYADKHVCWLLAHAIAATADAKEQYEQLSSLVLEPYFTRERIDRILREQPERVVLRSLALYKPDSIMRTELQRVVQSLHTDDYALPIATAFAEACAQTQPIPQWGRRYDIQTIRSTVLRIARISGSETIRDFMTEPRVAWLALHIEQQLQKARAGDRQQQLAGALLMLTSLAVGILDSVLVEAVLTRVLADNWLCGQLRTAPLVCLAAALLLDRSTDNTLSSLGIGLASTLAQQLPNMSEGDASQLATMLASLLSAAASARNASADEAQRLFVGSTLEPIIDWTQYNALVVTQGAIAQLEDRQALAGICEHAARGLDRGGYADVCAEFLAATAERIVQLAVPEIRSEDYDDENDDDVAAVHVDLSASATATLARVRLAVVRHLRENDAGNDRDRGGSRTTALLLHATSLLTALAVPEADDDDTAPADDRERLAREGDLRWLACDAVTRPRNAAAALAAVAVAARLRADAEESEETALSNGASKLDARHKQLLRALLRMPATEHESVSKPVAARALDLGFLEVLCGDRSPDGALAELVAALVARPECARLHAALPLVQADAQAAARVLPHAICGLLPHAPLAVRTEVAALLLDFAHNWSERAPHIARVVVARTLEARQLDTQYADIRAFVARLPLALFELADVASRIGQPEAAAFLLECDLTCTGAAAGLDSVTGAARTLLHSVYARLGSAAAAQLLGSVSAGGGVEQRCRDAGDWRTLLLYEEAAGGGGGDTLVQLGLLSAVQPDRAAPEAACAAAWRLGRWDAPVLPLACAPQEPEEALYRMLRLRSQGHVRAAGAAAQAFLGAPSAIAALTAPSAQRSRDAWPYHAVAALLPLVSGSDFSNASAAAMFVLARRGAELDPAALAPAHDASVALHAIILQEDASALPRFAIAARAAGAAARRAGAWQAAMRHVTRLGSELHARDVPAPELRLAEAATLWAAGSRRLAVEVLQAHKRELQRDTTGDDDIATIVLSRVLLAAGAWSAELRTERAEVLWAEYFDRAAQLLQGVRLPTAWTGRALHALASFAERQCIELTATRDSDAAVAMRKQKARELAACQREIARSGGDSAARLRSVLRRLETQAAADRRELAELRTSIGGFLRMALWAFVHCLECSDAFDSSAYALVALIVTHARSPELHQQLELVDAVPSRKLLPLARQLCARLGADTDPFHVAMQRLVTRMAIDFPYHTLYHLFALCNAERTTARPQPRRSSMAQGSESERLERGRSDAATAILRAVAGTSTDLRQIVSSVDELCSAYIELAASPVPESRRNDARPIAFSSRLRIARLRAQLPEGVPVLTAEPHADAPRDYMAVPFVSSIAEGYTLAGGINLPKIVRVLGSDGHRYKQLVKGKDDMRQDAVIQQLFHVINRFLAGRRAVPGLRMRTYNVVPLTKRCGVLQWVDSTMPLGNWFRANESRYRPNAPAMSQLRATVHSVHKDKAASAAQKRAVFDAVCEQAPPIFRFFFYQHFYTPQSWFARRETYIRSAAVSSMAGWALGIGDRHLQNILVDQATAELVHIDLGIAFDLGKLLPIPELVPFRLTREMVDGMGLLGLHGPFRHACQLALRAMRDNSHVLITILNVLKVDPLYMWSLIPLRIGKINRNASFLAVDDVERHDPDSEDELLLDAETSAAAAEEENKEAGRSIMHVGQRLSAAISAEGQISELIQQATDPALLSRMFEGWSAWY